MLKKLDGMIARSRVLVDGKPFDRFTAIDTGRMGFEDKNAMVVMDRDPETGIIYVRSAELFPLSMTN